jgi:hypothetical protein
MFSFDCYMHTIKLQITRTISVEQLKLRSLVPKAEPQLTMLCLWVVNSSASLDRMVLRGTKNFRYINHKLLRSVRIMSCKLALAISFHKALKNIKDIPVPPQMNILCDYQTSKQKAINYLFVHVLTDKFQKSI